MKFKNYKSLHTTHHNNIICVPLNDAYYYTMKNKNSNGKNSKYFPCKIIAYFEGILY